MTTAMTKTITFNYLKGGIVGHASVTISDGQSSVSLSSSADITGYPLGVYSTSHEQYRKWSAVNTVEKTVVVDDAAYSKVKAYFEANRETRSDYGYLFGTNCLDFTDTVYKMIGGEGSFGALFTKAELSGPIAGIAIQWRGMEAQAAPHLGAVTRSEYRDLTKADFGVSGGVVLAITLVVVALLARPPKARVRRMISRFRTVFA
ncbi:MAG: hypothetical protein KDJ55_09475 [Rhodobiaceae bacterium]|nr:hypothetical protein [Rhodobiaceae bacterium]MCC0012305.1 hypothetical protein [Rhodobiaceae bacterium]MCC0060780.1 hypothetical protein [Rhodobiaceae bacterium]